MRNKPFLIASLLCLLGPAAPVLAGPASDALGVCLTDSLTGKERKTLAKWIFMGIAAHPELDSLASIEDTQQAEIDRSIGALLTRLLADDCPEQSRTAFATEGSQAFTTAFELVGRVAMQELMTDPAVNQAISGFEKHLDQEKLNALN